MRAPVWVLGGAVSLLALTLSACGTDHATGTGTVAVYMSGSALGVEPLTHPHGAITFNVHNGGHHELHEVFVARTDVPAAELPLTADGTAVDRTSLVVLGEVADIAADGIATLAVQVEPGHHVIVCNMDGHGGSWLAVDFDVTH